MSKQYVSTRLYWDGVTRYRPGQPFTLHEGAKPSADMVPYAEGAKREGKTEGGAAAPDTLSELGKQNVKRDAKAEGKAGKTEGGAAA